MPAARPPRAPAGAAPSPRKASTSTVKKASRKATARKGAVRGGGTAPRKKATRVKSACASSELSDADDLNDSFINALPDAEDAELDDDPDAPPAEEDDDELVPSDDEGDGADGAASELGSDLGAAAEPAETLPGLWTCPFGVFEPTIRFRYAGDNTVLESLPDEVKKLLKWKNTTTTSTLIRTMTQAIGFKHTNKSAWMGTWGKHMAAAGFSNILPHQKINHFPGSFRIGRKDSLWRSISHMQSAYGKKLFNILPECFLLTRDRARLKQCWNKGSKNGANKPKWILKPNACARGIGIRVITDWQQVPKKKSCLIQRYIGNPLLVNGTKFDMRLYVYVASYDPLRVYICKDGLARFATMKYSNKTSKAKSRYMHLTNYSINKKSKDFVANDDADACVGNKWGLSALFQHLRTELGLDTDKIWVDMCDVVVKTLLSADGAINSGIKANCRQRSCVHELFGFDIMLDRNLKPWLIEVNISPSLHSQSKLDRDIKGRMLRDLFNISGYAFPAGTAEAAEAATARGAAVDPALLTAGKAQEAFMGAKPLTKEEKSKHAYYIKHAGQRQQQESIIDSLTDDDVRILMETEAENLQKGSLERIFPNERSGQYLQFTDSPRYYNILLDVWHERFRDTPSTRLDVLKAAAAGALSRKGKGKGKSIKADARLLKGTTKHAMRFLAANQTFSVPPLSRAAMQRAKRSATTWKSKASAPVERPDSGMSGSSGLSGSSAGHSAVNAPGQWSWSSSQTEGFFRDLVGGYEAPDDDGGYHDDGGSDGWPGDGGRNATAVAAVTAATTASAQPYLGPGSSEAALAAAMLDIRVSVPSTGLKEALQSMSQLSIHTDVAGADLGEEEDAGDGSVDDVRHADRADMLPVDEHHAMPPPMLERPALGTETLLKLARQKLSQHVSSSGEVSAEMCDSQSLASQSRTSIRTDLEAVQSDGSGAITPDLVVGYRYGTTSVLHADATSPWNSNATLTPGSLRRPKMAPPTFARPMQFGRPMTTEEACEAWRDAAIASAEQRGELGPAMVASAIKPQAPPPAAGQQLGFVSHKKIAPRSHGIPRVLPRLSSDRDAMLQGLAVSVRGTGRASGSRPAPAPTNTAPVRPQGEPQRNQFRPGAVRSSAVVR